MSQIEFIVKSTDLSEVDQQTVVQTITKLYPTLKGQQSELAGQIKSSLDDLLGAPWQVIVGKSFTSSITHEQDGFLYLYAEDCAFLCFKTA